MTRWTCATCGNNYTGPLCPNCNHHNTQARR